MSITTQSTGSALWQSIAQQKHYAGMVKYIDIEKLNLEEKELNEDECRQLFESYFDENGRYILSAEQKKRLDKAKQSIAAGLGISHEVVMKEIDEWLNEG